MSDRFDWDRQRNSARVIQEVFHLLGPSDLHDLRHEIDRRIGSPPMNRPIPAPAAPATTTTKRKVLLCC